MGSDPNNGRDEGVYGLHAGRWAWVPIPVLLAAMGVFWAAGWQGSHESIHLLLTLNIVFSLLVCLVVAYLIARSFLVRGAPGLLLLGCGVTVWGPAGVVATAAARGDANLSITIYNSCLWLSGLCHLMGVSLSLRPRRALSPPALWLLGGYAHAAGAVALVTLAALAGWIPAFYVEEQGGTPVRQAVLVSASAMFALTALLLVVTRRNSISGFAYWYALALLLIATGLLGVALQSYHASILGWTGRGTQALGGFYLLIAAVVSVRESRVWGVSLEGALQDANENLRVQAEQLQTLNDMLEVRQRALETANEDLRVQDAELRRQAEALRELNAALERKVAERTARLERRARQLQKLTLELSQAHEREHKRVAEILHEDLQQQIAGAKFQLNLLSSRSHDDASRQCTAAQINQILKDAIGMSRSLSHELSPAVFYGNDLGEALDWLGEQMEAKHGVAIHLEVLGDGTLQSETLTVFLFRAARELLSNAVRHAGVREVAVRLRRLGPYAGLRVSDQGRGFDLQELKETSGIGLLSIRERVELLGGRMKIASAKGRGTRVRIVVPDGSDGEG